MQARIGGKVVAEPSILGDCFTVLDLLLEAQGLEIGFVYSRRGAHFDIERAILLQVVKGIVYQRSQAQHAMLVRGTEPRDCTS